MFDAILFDLDGTLIDTESLALAAGLAAFAAFERRAWIVNGEGVRMAVAELLPHERAHEFEALRWRHFARQGDFVFSIGFGVDALVRVARLPEVSAALGPIWQIARFDRFEVAAGA